MTSVLMALMAYPRGGMPSSLVASGIQCFSVLILCAAGENRAVPKKETHPAGSSVVAIVPSHS